MRIRPAAQAGRFYADDPVELRQEIERLLSEARKTHAVPAERPRAIIAPHAGYMFSGPIAASAYSQLQPWATEIRSVLLIGPAHRAPSAALALSSADAFSTPLGLVRVDRDACVELRQHLGTQENDLAHREEHSLEVQLPFLQTVLAEFEIVPIVAGRNATPEMIVKVFDLLLDRPGWLAVISSDLSHFHQAEISHRLDAQTSDAIQRLAPEQVTGDRACGYIGIRGLLLAARKHDWHVTTIDLRNSGDTAGPRDAVVGYGAYVVC